MCNVRIVCKDKLDTDSEPPRLSHTKENDTGRESSDNSRVTCFLHDCINHGDRKTSKNCGQCTHADIWYMVVGVAVPDVLERKTTVKPNEPAGERE